MNTHDITRLIALPAEKKRGLCRVLPEIISGILQSPFFIRRSVKMKAACDENIRNIRCGSGR